MKGFLTGVAAVVIISGAAAIYFEAVADYSSQRAFTSQGSVRLDEPRR
ncbi:MAG TPA: hypothetical protein VHG92_15665 [Afifellaceae bacterium]|nr:hypothetical protein [Afifellaceae bacterium]